MIRAWKMSGPGKGEDLEVMLINLNTGPNNWVVEDKFNIGQGSTLNEGLLQKICLSYGKH